MVSPANDEKQTALENATITFHYGLKTSRVTSSRQITEVKQCKSG